MSTKRLLAIGLLALAATAANDVLACGDKFLVSSRGTRHQRAPIARTPASILVYANPASELPKALTNVPVEATLRKAGYRPTSVATAEELDAALRTGSFDLVVAGLAEVQALRDRTQVTDKSAYLPVLYNASASVLKQARKQYQIILKAPTRIEAFLETIDAAVALTQAMHAKSAK